MNDATSRDSGRAGDPKSHGDAFDQPKGSKGDGEQAQAEEPTEHSHGGADESGDADEAEKHGGAPQ